MSKVGPGSDQGSLGLKLKALESLRLSTRIISLLLHWVIYHLQQLLFAPDDTQPHSYGIKAWAGRYQKYTLYSSLRTLLRYISLLLTYCYNRP